MLQFYVASCAEWSGSFSRPNKLGTMVAGSNSSPVMTSQT